MLGKASIIGAVAAILITPTPVSAQMGGVVDPGVQVGGAVNPGATVGGAVGRGIPGPDLGTWRSPIGNMRSISPAVPARAMGRGAHSRPDEVSA